jgi:hypothetical protein
MRFKEDVVYTYTLKKFVHDHYTDIVGGFKISIGTTLYDDSVFESFYYEYFRTKKEAQARIRDIRKSGVIIYKGGNFAHEQKK